MDERFRLSRTSIAAISFGLFTLTWLVFGQTLQHEFINYDDPNYVYQNPVISAGVSASAFLWAFTHIHAQNWHPLTTLTHMLDCQLFGLRAAGHHFTNVLLHSTAAVLLFHLLRGITSATWRSAFVAAVFAVHPLRVESVAWVAERKDVLSGVFFMLTLASYFAYARHQSLRSYLLVLLTLACGLMSKPMLVSVPFLLLLLDYWPLQRCRIGRVARHSREANTTIHAREASVPWLLGEKLPLLAISTVSCVATLIAQKQYIGSGEDLPVSARLINAATSYVAYLRQMFWPTALVPFYPHPEHGVPMAELVLAIALLTAVTAIALALRKTRPYLAVGWFWYVGMLVPVIGLIQVGWQARADRYTYLPQIGLSIAFTWLVADVVKRRRIPRGVVGAVGALIISALASAAFVQTRHWRDSETLWRRTLAVTPDNDVAQNNLGIVLAARGRPEEAMQHYVAALKLRPDNVPAHINVANLLLSRGDTQGAIEHLRRVLELEPENAEAGNVLGLVLLRERDLAGALAQWNDTLHRNPDNGNAMANLAWVYATAADSNIRSGAKALQLAQRSVELAGSRNALVIRTLAAACAESGRFDDAITHAKRALQLAHAENNAPLVAELDATIRLYESHTPLRDPSLVQKN